MKYVAVFFAMLLTDVLWTRYIVTASDRRATKAALYSAGIVLAGAFTTLAYVEDPIYLLPAAAGAFLGTYLTVRYG